MAGGEGFAKPSSRAGIVGLPDLLSEAYSGAVDRAVAEGQFDGAGGDLGLDRAAILEDFVDAAALFLRLPDVAEGDSPIFVDHGCAAVPAKIGTVPAT